MKLSQLKREIAVQTRLQVRFEKLLVIRLKKEFSKTAALFDRAYIDSHSFDVVQHRHQERLKRILIAVLGEVILSFADRSTGKSGYLGLELKRRGSVFELSIQSWLSEHIGILAAILANNTFKSVAKVIREGELAEKHPRVIAREIVKRTGGDVGLYRANMIARTEVHSAAGYGALQSAKQSGLDLVKLWGSSEDHRTRPSHAMANRQRRELDDKFIIGGEHARYPGDPSLSAKQRIHCRCILLTVPREREL